MINHVRTLLHNTSGDDATHDIPGEITIPATFKSVPLATPLTKFRECLFGITPDRWLLNYRCWEFMSLLHRVDTLPDVLAFDSRITYFPPNPRSFTFGVTASRLDDDITDGLIFLGGQQPQDTRNGRLRYAWQVAIDETFTVSIVPYKDQSVTTAAVITDGLSDIITLPGTELWFRFTPAAANTYWMIESIQRPTQSLGQILATIEQRFNASDFDQIFKNTAAKFRVNWSRNDLPSKLSGLLLALAYRTEAYRTTEGI